MFYVTLMRNMLAHESAGCTQRRISGKFTLKPSAVISLLFAFFYAASPADLLPERLISSRAAYIDDVILCAAAACYFIADITAALEGRKMTGAADNAKNE
jgi:uncharacterized membrane protein YkvA (DUF1232 family)